MPLPILCLDFDGVCHSYTSGWKGATEIPDPPVPGLFEFLIKAVEVFDVQVFSSRSHEPGGIEALRRWFLYWSFDARDQGHLPWFDPDMHLSFPATKPAAMVTLDDRALTFKGVWPEPAHLLLFKPWNKR